MNGILPKIINKLAIISILEFLKKPIESLRRETTSSYRCHSMTDTIKNCHSKHPI